MEEQVYPHMYAVEKEHWWYTARKSILAHYLETRLDLSRKTRVLDVGCGTGTWLKAALDFGVADVFGVDGVEISPDKLHIPPERFRHQDLTRPWNLNRRFDAVMCLEVAEHLDAAVARTLIDALVKHGDRVYFSAACPGQTGQHHVNCQWPAYWQRLFNACGHVCEDHLRWQIWDDTRIEPWYRQNLFVARYSPKMAGQECRLKAVVHPAIWRFQTEILPSKTFEDHLRQIEHGRMPSLWYLTVPARAVWAKMQRKKGHPG